MIRTYSEIIKMGSFMDRFNYLKLGDMNVFAEMRYLNQAFYSSAEWRRIRDIVITRDLGLDLAFPGHEISGRYIIHHMNPVSVDDIVHSSDTLINPEYLILVSEQTHAAIHRGDETLLREFQLVERSKYDTCPWRQ